jgi:hypothetical protein
MAIVVYLMAIVVYLMAIVVYLMGEIKIFYYIVNIIQWNLSKLNLIWINFCVQFMQVKFTKIYYIGTLF